MEFKPCPVCGQKPFLFSEEEIMCINGECPVYSIRVKKSIWDIRAEVIGRDSQIRTELMLEYNIRNNLGKIEQRFSEI